MANTARSLSYITLDVFTTERYLGNPLALVLVPPGEDVDAESMQRVAREFNFSETVFLYETQDETTSEWRMRIFLVDAEITFAGHPTIGTASYVLSLLATRSSSNTLTAGLRCKAGLINISLDSQDNSVKAVIPHDFHKHKIALSEGDIIELQPSLRGDAIKTIDVVSPVKGMTFLVVELSSLEALASVGPVGTRPVLKLDQGWDMGFVGTAYYVRTGAAEGKYHYRTRMIEKTLEDPATGSMSCGLATLLAQRLQTKSADFVFTQGVEMGRMSVIGVSVLLNNDLKTVERTELKGSAVQVMQGTITL